MRLIVGLGNPGQAYVETRHNVGFWVVEALAGAAGWRFRRHAEASSVSGALAGQPVTLVKPQSYMNRSGAVVAAMLANLKLDLADLLVVHDDLDLPPGRLRIKSRGGAGGHNGVLSIIETLESDRFTRVKIGVGRPPLGLDAADYVLASASALEKAALDDAIPRAVEAVECWIAEGVLTTMNRFNHSPAQ